MLRAFSILLVILFSVKALANEDKVAVVVNNVIITEKDIFDRKNFFIQAQNATNLTKANQDALREIAVQSLIDEALLDEQVKKYSLKITEKDIEKFISSVEESRNLGDGFFKKKFAGNKGVYDSFLKKIRGDYTKTKINNEVLMRGIAVSNSEVDDIAIRYVGKDAILDVREFSLSSDSDKAYKIFRDVRISQKDCNKTVKAKGYSVSSWKKKLSEISPDQRELFIDLKTGDFTAIIDKKDSLVMYQLCNRKIEGISEQENDNLTNYIGNKKLNYKMHKYLETIRSKAYIKIMK